MTCKTNYCNCGANGSQVNCSDMLKIKMCGFTQAEDVSAACILGVDAIGFVFYPPSPRNVSIEHAQGLLAELTPFVTSVGLFVDEVPEKVEAVINALPIDLLQFHGSESAEYCEQFSRPYLKALKIAPSASDAGQLAAELARSISEHPKAQGYLLDALVAGQAGGTGQSFDWTVLAEALNSDRILEAIASQKLIIAGGLDVENCRDCVEALKPYALDVSSGIEKGKGIKAPEKMRAFVEAARS